jgi:hypothetical protein
MDEWVSVQDIAPNLLATVGHNVSTNARFRKLWYNTDGLTFEDVKNNLPAREASEFMALLNLVGSIDRFMTEPDQFIWPWESSGVYSARSTYKMLCHGTITWEGAECIWRSWAPLKCKIFCWLAWRDMMWTCVETSKYAK